MNTLRKFLKELYTLSFLCGLHHFFIRCVQPTKPNVFEQRGEMFKNIVVPFTDGKRAYNVVANLEKTYKSEGEELIRAYEKSIMLAHIDDAWKEHLREMDDLKQSVQNATYEQKDPLLIYKFESFGLFSKMIIKVNRDVLAGFERLLGDYFAGDRPERDGVPSVRWCAEQLHLSANYFGDLVKKETGKSAQEYIQLKVIDIAKERIFDPGRSISEIAYSLGFRYPQHFTRLFKKVVGCSPNEYRTAN